MKRAEIALGIALSVGMVAAILAWKVARRTHSGTGIVHHIMTKGVDYAAIVGLVVGTVCVVAWIVLKQK